MEFRLPPVAGVMGYLIAFAIVGIAPVFCNTESAYTPWGIDEYQFFGLTKQELSTKFKDKLFFSKDFERATFSKSGTGLGFIGSWGVRRLHARL
jgi:hypothetical protein